MKTMGNVCLVIVCVCLACFPVVAQSNRDLAEENVQLRQRVENLEMQLAEVLEILKSQKVAAEAQVVEEKPVAPSRPTTDSPAVTSRFPVTLYGYTRLDASYDQSRTNNGELAFIALPGDENDGKDELTATARGTRLGLRIDGPTLNDIDTNALVEIDFSGGGDDVSNNPRLRHAWFDLVFPDQWRLLVGQTWDVPGPRITRTVNRAIAWRGGNVGFRKPQARVEKWFDGEDTRLLFQAAAALPYSLDHDKDGVRDGRDAGMPDFQGRIAYKFPLIDSRSAEFGLGGHYGRRRITRPVRGEREFDSWSVVFDAQMGLFNWLTLEGELWTGQFMEGFQGGAGQGFDMAAGRPIESWGGFAQLLFDLHQDWKLYTGIGVDNPDVVTADLIDRNLTYFLNLQHNFTRNASVGLEYQRIETDYKSGDLAGNHRFHTTFQFMF